MLIGNRYSDNKLYRGIRHYDSLPLTSGDLHEYADILQKKNAFIMNNLLGSGILNEPRMSISSTGASLLDPAVLLVDGDVSLIQSDNGEILKVSDIQTAGISEGVLCVVGWYQSLTYSSTLRSYGGVNNTIIPNDIIDKDTQIQVSTRYQLRWDTVILHKSLIDTDSSIAFMLGNRDATGERVTGTTQITSNSKIGDVRVATKPASMDYAVSDLYIIPIIQYVYSNNTLTDVKPFKALKPEGSTRMIKSTVEPTKDIEDGDIWYNTSTKKFKFYIEGVGFVPTASDITFMQYHNTTTISSSQTNTNIRVPIGITDYTEKDILQVIYGGVVLTEGVHYTVNISANTITLLDFTTEVGDLITFIVIKLVDTSTVSAITGEFNSHVNKVGSIGSKGHVELSDSASATLDNTRGVAATPKAIYDATTLIDSVTSKKYRITVSNGILGVTEIS